MKKFIAFIAIIGMVAISINTQATTGCWGGGGSGTCVVNTSANSSTYEGTTYFANPYQLLTITMHVVSLCSGGGGVGTVSAEGGSCSLYFQGSLNQGEYRTADYNRCDPDVYTGDIGYVDIAAQALGDGYVYVNATW